ncbi:MAG: tetratricopeptide repeat protein, partial [Plesiomonas shigelloides]
LAVQGQYPEAESALRKALAQQPNAADYALLANVLEKAGHPQDAGEMRRRGLALVDGEHHA